MFTQACREQRPTTVELQLVVEIIQLLLDVRGTRTVITGAERQQHVDLEYKKTEQFNFYLEPLATIQDSFIYTGLVWI